MKKIWMASVSALALAAVSSPAVAAGDLYIAAGVGGATFLGDRDWTRLPPPSADKFTSGTQDFESGPIFEAAIGFDMGTLGTSMVGLRVELQGTYIDFDVGDITWGEDESSPPPGLTSGHLSETLYMVNLLLDFDVGAPVTPYLGGGLGIAHSEMNAVRADGPSFLSFTNQDDTGFVGQIIAGLSAAATPYLDFYGQYRGIFLPEVEFKDFRSDLKGTDVTYESQISHAFTVGIRVKF